MKQVFTLLMMLAIFATTALAQNDRDIQNDPKATEILDRVSAKYQGIKSLEMVFNMRIKSEMDGLDESYLGSAYLKNDKYRVSTEMVEIICDNVKRWTILKEVEEVQINFYEPDAENIESPTKLFTIYKDGYFYKLEGTETLDGKQVQVIKLIPQELDASLYKAIFLYIDGSDVIRQARIEGKDGVVYLWTIKEFNPGLTIDDDVFKFDATAYPNFTIEDLTK